MDRENLSDIDKLFDEEINFKALTDGLGFHHSVKSKEDVQRSLKSKSTELKRDFDTRIKQLSNQNKMADSIDMGDLAPFYKKESSTKTGKFSTSLNIEEVTMAPEDETIVAGTFERLGAWIIDFIMVTVLFVVMLLSTIFLSETPLSLVRELVLGREFFITLLPLYVGFYIFYFSFFDKTLFSSPGKKIFGLRVESISKKQVSLMQSLGRSVITLVSFLTVGLLVLLDAQSRLTDTKVVRR